jgi:hypothetical protein
MKLHCKQEVTKLVRNILSTGNTYGKFIFICYKLNHDNWSWWKNQQLQGGGIEGKGSKQCIHKWINVKTIKKKIPEIKFFLMYNLHFLEEWNSFITMNQQLKISKWICLTFETCLYMSKLILKILRRQIYTEFVLTLLSNKNETNWWVPVIHTYNPSYSGGRDEEDHSLRLAWGNSS